MIDKFKRLVAIRLTGGNGSDYRNGEELMGEVWKFHPQTLAADKGYDGNSLRATLKRKHVECCIPPLRHRRDKYTYDADKYKLRKGIEHYFGHLKEFRAIATRYNKTAAAYLSFVYIAATLEYLKTIC